jgi:phage-related protein
MTWTVETLGEVVDAEIASLPKDMQAAFLRLAGRIEAVGLERIGPPHVKHLRDKLWEMRFSGRDGIARAIYVTAAGRRVIVVHAFTKKTRKTPQAALTLADRRAKEIKP